MSFRTNLADRLQAPKTRIASVVGELITYTNRGTDFPLYAKIGPSKTSSAESLGTDADVTERSYWIPTQTIPTNGAALRVPGLVRGFEIGDYITFEDARWSVVGVENPDGKRIEWEVKTTRVHPRRIK